MGTIPACSVFELLADSGAIVNDIASLAAQGLANNAWLTVVIYECKWTKTWSYFEKNGGRNRTDLNLRVAICPHYFQFNERFEAASKDGHSRISRPFQLNDAEWLLKELAPFDAAFKEDVLGKQKLVELVRGASGVEAYEVFNGSYYYDVYSDETYTTYAKFDGYFLELSNNNRMG